MEQRAIKRLQASHEDELERENAELRRANHRLSGALQIVLDTLDSENVGELFQRVLEEVTSTMEADGTLCYLAEPSGFRLRGVSEGLNTRRVAHYMAYGRALETLVTRVGHAMRLRVQAPKGVELRGGRLAMRVVQDEESGNTTQVPARLVPPFASFFAVPVWFGGSVVAMLEVGWERQRSLRQDDAELLDAVAHYLSVQLVGAFAQMRQQRRDRLRAASSALRERLIAAVPGEGSGVVAAFEEACRSASGELGAQCAPLDYDTHTKELWVTLPRGGRKLVPFGIDDLGMSALPDATAVVAVDPSDALGSWLDGLGEPCVGALADAGEVAGTRLAAFVLRERDAEPFDAVELGFLRTFCDDVHTVGGGEEAWEQDKRISQTLQTGMKNELQHVDGISAEASYTSATASALVGGDFYDLIRLPGRKACVIMGDVSGKGVEAASVSAAVKTALGAYAWEGLAPARMVRNLNDFLLGFSRLETFATLFVGVVDLAAATLTYCSAGHPPARLARAATGELETLAVQSGVVGAFPDMLYQDGVVDLAAGDVLVLYTDGTTEARDPKGRFFGEDGLVSAVSAEAAAGFEGLVERLLGRLYDFAGGHLEDDVALLALRFDELDEK